MNILVTGSAGFIGSNLCRALTKQGHTMRGIDDFSTGKRENLEGIEGLDFMEGDIKDENTLRTAMKDMEYVLHQAAIPSVPRSVKDPVRSHHANITGTLMVLEAARHSGIKRVVVASSSSAYGDTPVLPKVETMMTTPQSPYAVSKLAGEFYACAYTKVYGLETVSLRYFNVFGPYQDPEGQYAAVIPKFVKCVLQDKSPSIYGDGKQTRDFTYIDNVVEANLKSCTAKDAAGQAFNIACGERVDLLTILQRVNKILGKNVQPDFQPPRAGDVRDSLADIGLARKLLGYEGSIDFSTGLDRAIDWYKANLI